MSWLVPQEALSLEQVRGFQLNPSEHRVILGAPGSGKSQLLLHRARYLRGENSVHSGQFQIFVYTNVLKEYIRAALADLGLPEHNVSTFDHWCTEFYRANIGRRIPWSTIDRQPDFGAIRSAVRQRVNGSKPLYDFVLVDEGQDLDKEGFEIIKAITKHITVCVDHRQQIFDKGATQVDILGILGLRRPSLVLLEAFRCCPYIVRLASEFIGDFDERSAFLNQTRVAQTEIETPLLFEARDWQDEKNRLLEVLRTRQLMDRSIGILFPQNRQVEGFAKGLRECGFEVETLKTTGLNFNNSIPKLLSYHSAKGLTFDSVLLPRLVPTSFPRASSDRVEKLLYVGITRATRWVYMSTRQNDWLPQLIRLRSLSIERKPVLTIQDAYEPGTTETHGAQSVDDILDLL